MWHRGRRPGLQLGYGLAAVGGVIAAIGAERKVLAVFVAGLFLFGSGQASNLLARYAATDLADPDHRGRAMSRVVFASTFGAVFGPLLIAPAERAGEEWFGFDRYTGPWLFSAVCFAVAMVNTAVRLRPDPLVVAGGGAMAAGAASPPIRHAVRVIGAAPRARLALGSMAVSQAAMVAVMTMTPVHMRLHGHEAMSPYVISAHIGGMFAFSPLVGRYVDRRGSLSAVQVGAAILVAATLLASTAGITEWLLFPALWALGLGWNFGLLGGSALLIESVVPAERVARAGDGRLDDEPVRSHRRLLVRLYPSRRRLSRARRHRRRGRPRAAHRRVLVGPPRSTTGSPGARARAGGHRRRAGLTQSGGVLPSPGSD